MRLLMHVTGGGLHVLDRCHWQNAVSEVENVTGTSAGALEHGVDGFKEPIERRQEHRGIEIALHGAVASDAIPCLVERRPPVDANHVSPGFAQLAKNRAGADPKMDRRYAERRNAG